MDMRCQLSSRVECGLSWSLAEQELCFEREAWAWRWGRGGVLPSTFEGQRLLPSPSQLCQEPCAEDLSFSPPETLGWTLWEPWSSCSRSCLTLGGGPGWRSRSRLCPSPEDNSCPGVATQEEPCSPPVCPGVPPLSLEWPEH